MSRTPMVTVMLFEANVSDGTGRPSTCATHAEHAGMHVLSQRTCVVVEITNTNWYATTCGMHIYTTGPWHSRLAWGK